MPELDHHPEHESHYDCEFCRDTGKLDGSDYYDCAHCSVAQERVKLEERMGNMKRSMPTNDAVWSLVKSERKRVLAVQAADLALLKSKLIQKERELAEVRAEVEARKLNPLNPFYDIEKDKEFREDFARLAEQGISKKQRGIILRGVMQAIHAYAADEARKAVAAMSTPNKGESTLAAKEQA